MQSKGKHKEEAGSVNSRRFSWGDATHRPSGQASEASRRKCRWESSTGARGRVSADRSSLLPGSGPLTRHPFLVEARAVLRAFVSLRESIPRHTCPCEGRGLRRFAPICLSESVKLAQSADNPSRGDPVSHSIVARLCLTGMAVQGYRIWLMRPRAGRSGCNDFDMRGHENGSDRRG
jgi:hypothetical protein